MAEEDFKKLPRSLVHRLQDYEIDQSSLKGFITEKKSCSKDEETGVISNRMDRDDQQHNSFAAKIEKLGDENRALPYKIKNKTKHVLIRFVQWGRGFFAGRLYKVRCGCVSWVIAFKCLDKSSRVALRNSVWCEFPGSPRSWDLC